MASTSSMSRGPRLPAPQAFVPLTSRHPACRRAPTQAGEPARRSCFNRNLPPTKLPSVSVSSSGLAAAPVVVPEPARPRVSSQSYELAAIAFLSTGPVRPETGTQPHISPPKLSHVIRRPSSPVFRKSAARGTNLGSPGAMSGPLYALPSTRASQRSLCDKRLGTRFVMMRRTPQVASPVPRKHGSSVAPALMTARQPSVLHTCGRKRDTVQSQPDHLSHSFLSGGPPTLATIAVDLVDPRFGRTLEAARGIGSHCTGLAAESSGTKGAQSPKSNLTSIRGETSRDFHGRPEAYAELPVPSTLRKGQSHSDLQHTSVLEARDGLLPRQTLEERACAFRDMTLRAGQQASPDWPETTGEKVQVPSRLAPNNAHESIHPAAGRFPRAGDNRLSRTPFPCSCMGPPQPQWTYCTNSVDDGVDMVLKSSAGDLFLLPHSRPEIVPTNRAEHMSTGKMRGGRKQHCFIEKVGDIGVHASTIKSLRDMVSRTGSSAPRKCDYIASASSPPNSLFLPSLDTHATHYPNVRVPRPPAIEHGNSVGTSFSPLTQVTFPNQGHSHPPTRPLRDPPQSPPNAAEPFFTQVVTSRRASAVVEASDCGALTLTTYHSNTSGAGLPSTSRHALPGERRTPTDSTANKTGYTPPVVSVPGGSASTATCAALDAFLKISVFDDVQKGSQNICTALSAGTQQVCHGEQKKWRGWHEYCESARDKGGRRVGTPGEDTNCERSAELSQASSVDTSAHKDCGESAVVTEVVRVDADPSSFSELQRTLRELQAHPTALRASDIVFDTTVRQGLPSVEGSADRTAEKSRDFFRRHRHLPRPPLSCMNQGLHYCVLEEGSFGKVFAGHFLGRLPTRPRRRWWRPLPLCEGFVQAPSCPVACPAPAFLSVEAQDAIEHNVKVAIKVPVETMMLQDPLGTLARTLNEWKILTLVHEKRETLFLKESARENIVETLNSEATEKNSRRYSAAHPAEPGNLNSECTPAVFCEDHVSAERLPSFAFERWHPMHPQAEPPGVVELVGGVVHGPLDVWLVTRLAPGKDLHTRKYSRSLAGGISIPPAAGLAMCRQLAAIVDFLHSGPNHMVRGQCAAVAAVHSHQQRGIQEFSGEPLRYQEDQISDSLETNACLSKPVPGNCRGLPCGVNLLSGLSDTPVIVHRDIKPENIIVDDNWRIQLCDFGDAEASADGVVSRVSGATWLYAPVELLCAAPLRSTTGVHRVKRAASLYPQGCGDRTAASTPCHQACDASCGSRARSSPPADTPDEWLEGYASNHAYRARSRLVSSSRYKKAVLTEKWDIWSMGCVFQEMFGFPNPLSPYVTSADPPHIIYEKLKSKAHCGQLVPIVAPEIQGTARRIIMACLNSDPQLRPSAADVLRMWSAPEEEILKDIHAPLPLPVPMRCVPYAENAPAAASWESAAAAQPAIDAQSAFMLGCQQHEQTAGDTRSLHKLNAAEFLQASPRCAEEFDGRMANGKQLNGQDQIYVVPNLAIVPDQ